MRRSHYGLQALLYAVALHRYLRWRIPGYSADRDLAGVAYLFVRGMIGAGTPTVGGMPYGVFWWRPPAGVVEGLSDVLDGRVPNERGGGHGGDGGRGGDGGAGAGSVRRPAGGPGAGTPRRLQPGRGPRAGRRPRRPSGWPGWAGRTTSRWAWRAALAVRGPRLGHVFVDLARIRETAAVETDERGSTSRRRLAGAGRMDRAGGGEFARSGWARRTVRPAAAPDRLGSTSTGTGGRSARWRRTCRGLAGARVGRCHGSTSCARGSGGFRPRRPMAGSAWPPARPSCARWPSSPGGRGPGRRRPWPGSSRCSPSRRPRPGRRRPLVGLAAPTGKAAARLEEAVHAEAGGLGSTLGSASCSRSRGLDPPPAPRVASGGARAGSATTGASACPHDVVIVDETSMVSLL